MKSRRQKRKGYVLLLVLMVLVVSTAVLATASRRGLQAASEASAAQRQLQLRWGAASLRYSLLPKTWAILKEIEDTKKQPCRQIRMDIPLGGTNFQVLLADESAKANANLLMQRGGEQALMQSLDRLQANSPQRLSIRLRPSLEPDITNPSLPSRYESLDQLFTANRPNASAADQMSMWFSIA